MKVFWSHPRSWWIITLMVPFVLSGCKQRDDVTVMELPAITDTEPEPEIPDAADKGQRIIGVIVTLDIDGEKGSYFFKIMGSPSLVAKRSAALEDLVKKVDFSKTDKLPKRILEAAPSDWMVTRNRNEMIQLTLRTANRLTPINLEISIAKGDLSDNLNRWRGQVGLDPVSEEELKKCYREFTTTSGQKALFVDITGPGAVGMPKMMMPPKK